VRTHRHDHHGTLFVGCDSAASDGASASPTGEEQSAAPAEDTEAPSEDVQTSEVVLEWETTATSEKIPSLQELIDAFAAETGIEIELVTRETIMKR
jgi:ABC-type glycerol-3-phosphate transport system substrate-binding protein